MFVQASAAIWAVQKQLGNQIYKLSTFLNALSKVSSKFSEKGHLLYQPTFFETILTEFQSTIDKISMFYRQDSSLSILQSIKFEFKTFSDLYNVYQQTFKLYIKLDRADYSNEILNHLVQSPTLDVFRFGWLMLLFSKHIFIGKDCSVQKSWIIWCVVFIATQLEDSNLRSIDYVLKTLEVAQPNSINQKAQQCVWKTQFEQMVRLLARCWQVEAILIELLPEFCAFLQVNMLF